MREVRHHVPDAMLAAYASGSLGYPFALVVASHVSLCDECRSRLGAHELAGGLVLEALDGAPVTDAARRRTLSALDADAGPVAPPRAVGIFPAPLATVLGGTPPRWRSLGLGTRQAIVWRGEEGSVRLLSIPGGQAVPDHGHRGLELTLVLAGSFSDEGGRYDAGDLEVADEALVHIPTAGAGAPCICLAATDAPLRFRSFVPRLLQPLFGI